VTAGRTDKGISRIEEQLKSHVDRFNIITKAVDQLQKYDIFHDFEPISAR
jgi:hypothetical protein